MNNLRVDVTSIGPEHLISVLNLFGHKTEGYKIDKNRFIVYWALSETKDVTAFPFKMETMQLAQFIIGWLNITDYGTYPDIDGDVKKGWRCYNEEWGHVDGKWQAFAAIEPVWALYGK